MSCLSILRNWWTRKDREIVSLQSELDAERRRSEILTREQIGMHDALGFFITKMEKENGDAKGGAE